MRATLLALLFIFIAHRAAAQPTSEFDWSTTVIHRFARPAAAQTTGSPATGGFALDQFAPGSTIYIELHPGIEGLIAEADESGIHVIAEVDPAKTAVTDAAKAVRAGLDGLIVAGEAESFRQDLETLLDSGTPLRIWSNPQGGSAVVEPPREVIQPKTDPETLYATADRSRIIRIRVDEWSPPVVRTLLLMPGGVYVDGPLGATAKAIEAFRLRHPAVGAGRHEPLINSVYTFRRWIDGKDEVVVVLGAEGKISINVSRVFPDDTLLRDALTGQTAFVSFGMATFEADSSGVVLIEELR